MGADAARRPQQRSVDADGLALVEPVVIYGTVGERAYTLRHAYWRSGTGGQFDDDDATGELDPTQRWIGYELIEDLHLPTMPPSERIVRAGRAH